MLMGSFLFKQKAREALKGNWQTALLVSFFSGIFTTIAQVLRNVTFSDVRRVMDSLSRTLGELPQDGSFTSQQIGEVTGLYQRLFGAIDVIPQALWVGLMVAYALALVLTPVLSVSCCRYFICRNVGEDIGLREGLLGRMPIWGRALWLHVMMYVKIFLWSLLFFIPGVIAMIRYSMAPYYLAENPQLTAREALRKSKETMKDKKLSYLMLMISFVGWSMLINAAQLLLGSLLGPIITMVAAQFLSLWVTTYMSASCAAFYRAASHPDGLDEVLDATRRRMKAMGMSDSDIDASGFMHRPDEREQNGDSQNGENEE